jgi:hypothetical protein
MTYQKITIPLDHGNRNMKTAEEVFTSGFVESDLKPVLGEYLEYNGKFYSLTGERIPYMRDKTLDDRFFILTLFGIGKELERRTQPQKDTIYQVAEFLNSLGREKAQYIVKAIRAYQFMDARTEKQQDSDRVVYEYQKIKQIVLQIMSEHENFGGIPVDMPEYQTSCIEDNMNAESNILDGLDESAVDGIMNSLLAFQNNK